MKRLKVTVQYDGTDYCGWQKQLNGTSVQEKLTEAFCSIAQNVSVTGSGRTDSGVHARAMVCHVDADITVPIKNIPKAVNAHLPSDIAVLSCEEVDKDFHARYSAKRKTYAYHVYVSELTLPLLERYAVRLDTKPNVEMMRLASAEIVGEHDFKCFLASGSSVKDTVRTVYSIDIEEKDKEIVFKVCGNGFLYNMVRIIVGTLLEVGYGRKSADDIKEAIASGERKKSGKTYPAKGLELFSVDYI